MTARAGATRRRHTKNEAAPMASSTASATANATARRDMRIAVATRPHSRNTPRTPWPVTRRRACPSAITVSALRLVFSSRTRIARASSDSGHAADEEEEEASSDEYSRDVSRGTPSRARCRTRHTSRSTRAMVATPASRSGCAAGLARYDARDTEHASFATRRSAAPSLAPIRRPTTSCDRRAMRSLPASTLRRVASVSSEALVVAAAADAASITSESRSSPAAAIGLRTSSSVSSKDPEAEPADAADESSLASSEAVFVVVRSGAAASSSPVASPWTPFVFSASPGSSFRNSSAMRSQRTELSCSLRKASRIKRRPSGVAGAIARRMAYGKDAV
mmetsp:Transcript_3624/g.15342  ORF Transcript_3624/g.15342 Transcript_3624/m.15342 type:complete len:335 (+) Transcript_3624:156-1160(+)